MGMLLESCSFTGRDHFFLKKIGIEWRVISFLLRCFFCLKKRGIVGRGGGGGEGV